MTTKPVGLALSMSVLVKTSLKVDPLASNVISSVFESELNCLSVFPASC